METSMIETLEPIGIIHSPYTDIENMPIQPRGAAGIDGTVEVYDPFVEGLTDLEGFSHIYLLYWFHRVQGTCLMVTPFLDTAKRGVFATRAPQRPNHIGLSIVRLLDRAGGLLSIRGVDILDGTPLLDIKPYIEKFDSVKESTSGWMNADGSTVANMRSDGRFT